MFIRNRQGQTEKVNFDRIREKIESFTYGLNTSFVDIDIIAQKTIQGFYDGISTEEVDRLSAEVAAYLSSTHPDYSKLAARICVSALHKKTSESMKETMGFLHGFKDVQGNHTPLISNEIYDIVCKHEKVIQEELNFYRDFQYDYFGFKTLERSYLLKVHGEIVERPQHMLMRVSLGIHGEDLDSAFRTYRLMSQGWFTHASPTLFNAGTNKPQMSSCFLLQMQEDSIDGIYQTLKQCALISQSAGGIGLSVHNIRAKGSFIKGTNGVSNGLVPMLRVFNDTARYVDQGGGKRKGAFAIYLEPWHADILDFLELKKNHGKEELRARDLFYALWVNDLFMERVENDAEWSLFCPATTPELPETYGDEFRELYLKFEKEGKAIHTMKARDLWFAILESQIETGSPFMLFKDHANNKSNQKNLGTIKSSNLCTEIIQYTSPDEIAVCNLASIALPMFVENGKFDHETLYDVTYQVTLNLNKVIDKNYYPVAEAKNSNHRHRPIGIGVQGLADALFKLRMPFESDEAKITNKEIFETIYYASLSASADLAKQDGAYETFEGSPISKGIFQFDMWGATPTKRWDWEGLRSRIMKDGVRNSLLLAPMPTASTSQILGNTECIEPITSNLYTRRVLSGEFAVVNKYLVSDLVELGIWTPEMKDEVIKHNGSIQNIEAIPADIRELYKTVWEIKQKRVLEMAADRAVYIDQSQSLNVHMTDVNFAKLSSLHFHAWKLGLKTGMYYLRTKAAVDAIKFTIRDKNKAETQEIPSAEVILASQNTADMVCSLDNPEECLSCGS